RNHHPRLDGSGAARYGPHDTVRRLRRVHRCQRRSCRSARAQCLLLPRASGERGGAPGMGAAGSAQPAFQARHVKWLLRRRVSKSMAKTTGPRLTQPMIRDNDVLRPATWDEAMDRAAHGLRTQVAQHGPQAFGMFSCSKTTNELNYIAQK